jgi:hypothetical protein
MEKNDSNPAVQTEIEPELIIQIQKEKCHYDKMRKWSDDNMDNKIKRKAI